MSQFQNIIGAKLAQAAIISTTATIYNVPALTQAYIKDIDICNTTGSAITINIYLVPSGASAGTSNALYYGYSVAANSVLQWRGLQILNAGDFVAVSASGTGCTITMSGAQAT
jgi:hypothetical protein